MNPTDFELETLQYAEKQAILLHEKFMDEVRRLLQSGALDRDNHHRGLLFGVALNNVAEGYVRGDQNSKEFKNLSRF